MHGGPIDREVGPEPPLVVPLGHPGAEDQEPFGAVERVGQCGHREVAYEATLCVEHRGQGHSTRRWDAVGQEPV